MLYSVQAQQSDLLHINTENISLQQALSEMERNVEPSARGLGLGQALIHECTQFAREVGYSQISLWTNSVLTSAHRLYLREGYKLVKSMEHDTLGMKLIGEVWGLLL